ncbi:MAG: hypothetical protein ABIT36_11960 [Steroidobacteraceae bacterium]
MSLRLWLAGLLVCNVLVFAWAHWIDTDPKRTTEPPAPVRAVVNRPDVAPPVATVETAPVEQRCVSVGPFRDTAETTQAIEAFRTASYEPQSRAQTALINDGHWVYVDTLKSAADQRRTVAAIKRAGIDDVVAMPESDPPFMVSVGTFSDRNRATRRAEVIRGLNIDAKVDVHARSTTFYWLDMEQRPGDEALRLDVLNDNGTSLGGLTITACPVATSDEK